MSRQERRAVPFETKSLDAAGTFHGLASVYGNEDLHGDVVTPGAFTKTISERGASIPLLWQHNQAVVIGKGTLEDRPEGLGLRGKLTSSTQAGREALALLREGYIDGLSIGYSVIQETFEKNVRLLTEIQLWEVSLVTFPANDAARIEDVKRRISRADYSGIRRELDSFRAFLDRTAEASEWRMAKLEAANFGHFLQKHDQRHNLAALRIRMLRLLDRLQREATR